MRSWIPAVPAATLALAVAGCGSAHVDTAAYTCGQFNKSLRTKGDDSAGTFIRELRNEAKLGQDRKTEEREITLGIIVACHGKPAAATPGSKAIVTAKAIKSGKFKLPPRTKKKSNN